MRWTLLALCSLALHDGGRTDALLLGLRCPPLPSRVGRIERRRAMSVQMAGAAAPGPGAEWGMGDEVAPLSSEDMAVLSSRICALDRTELLGETVRKLGHAFVLVFDADTVDEGVYVMDVPESGEQQPGGSRHEAVVAFETRADAEHFAHALKAIDAGRVFRSLSVEGLSIESLVVASRDADMRVAVVFATAAGAPSGKISPTLVPPDLFAGVSSADVLGSADDEVWVLEHDGGTADAQLYSVTLDGTASVICFKDRVSADTCCRAIAERGEAVPRPTRMVLADVFASMSEELLAGDADVCVVDEVEEVFLDEVTR